MLRLVRETESEAERGGIFPIKLNSSFRLLVESHPSENVFIEFLSPETGIISLGENTLQFSLRSEACKECFILRDDCLALLGSCQSRIIVQQDISEEVSAQLKQQTESARADRNKPKAKIVALTQSAQTKPVALPSLTKRMSLPRCPSLSSRRDAAPQSESTRLIPAVSASVPPPRPRHSWIVLQGVSSAASVRDVEQFLDGVSLSPPLDSSPLDGVVSVFYSLTTDPPGELYMDVYVKCQTCDGALVASLRNNEPFVVQNYSNRHPVGVRANLPPCEVYWARGVGLHLTHSHRQRSGRALLESYSESRIPMPLMVFESPFSSPGHSLFQKHTHFSLFQLLGPSLRHRHPESKKRKRRHHPETIQPDQLTEDMWLLSGRQSCSMAETQYGFRSQREQIFDPADPLESFVGAGLIQDREDPSRCVSCALLIQHLEILLAMIADLWTNLMVNLSPSMTSAIDRSPLDYLDRYWQSYAGLYKVVLKEFHQKGRIASCAGHAHVSATRERL